MHVRQEVLALDHIYISDLKRSVDYHVFYARLLCPLSKISNFFVHMILFEQANIASDMPVIDYVIKSDELKAYLEAEETRINLAIEEGDMYAPIFIV